MRAESEHVQDVTKYVSSEKLTRAALECVSSFLRSGKQELTAIISTYERYTGELCLIGEGGHVLLSLG